MAAIAVIFIFGCAIGSFLNVVIMRYDGERPFFSFSAWGGRSQCMSCRKQLRWFELVPILSFIFQRGRCRSCGARLPWQYPAVELLTGLIFLLPFLYFFPFYSFPALHPHAAALSFGFALIALAMLVISAVDLRLMLIPDELSGIIAVFGALFAFLDSRSFLGNYAVLFPAFSPFISHFLGGVIGFGILGLITLLSRGRAMGMGDVKLAGAMGLVLGFPDIIFALTLGFFAGGIFGMILIALRGIGRETMKMMVPFGPFLVFGFWLHIFFVQEIFARYFALI